ncbi:hypothetical protein CsSME_00024493 [Camellia sinensis var. sinensis]
MLNHSIKIHKFQKAMSFSNSSSSSLSLIIPHASHADPQELSIIRRLDSCKSTRELKQIHSYIIKTKATLETQLIYTKFISICAISHNHTDLSYVNAIFTQVSNPSISVYNAIIKCFSCCKNSNDSFTALLFYYELLVKGLVPDNYTYPFVLKAST